jgi:hypothetical protein
MTKMKYKYTRKVGIDNLEELITRYANLKDQSWCSFLDEVFKVKQILLATLSPKEESQRIMMEQVDVTRCNKDVTKQDKPVNSEIPKIVKDKPVERVLNENRSTGKHLDKLVVPTERNSKFYEYRLKETITDGSIYIPELLLAILKEIEKQNETK